MQQKSVIWVTLFAALCALQLQGIAIAEQVPVAEQNCANPVIDEQGFALISCDVKISAPQMAHGEKLSLQYHIRPGFDVSLPATIPDAKKVDTVFSSEQDWQCVSQGAPQPPAHGCFIKSEDFNAANGETVFHSEILLRNPNNTRDIQSCFRIVGGGADRALKCQSVAMNAPEASLSIKQSCNDVRSDGSFASFDCSISVVGAHLLPKTFVQLRHSVLVGDVMIESRVLNQSSVDGWACESAQCSIDSDDLSALGGSSKLELSQRVAEPHVDRQLSSCVQVTTRTPKLAGARNCVVLNR